MAFQFNNYATNELSKSPINDIISNLFGGYEKGVKASYLQPTLAEQLQKSKLENQYYGPNMESQIGLRGAQAGHLGSLTTGQNITNKFLPESLQSQIDVNHANAQKARILQIIREQIMGDGQQEHSQITNPQESMGMYQGQGIPNGLPQQIQRQMQPSQASPFPQGQVPQQQQQQAQSPMAFGGDYAKAALASQLLGLGSGKIVDVNGKQVAITPFGNFDTGVHGLTEEQKAREAGFGKEDSKLYGEAVHSYGNYSNQAVALDELTHAAENNPQFRNVTGRLNQPITNWFGSPEQQKLLGTLQTASGEIALTVAPSLKGAWTGRDQSMLNEIKAGPRDFPDVFIGKLKAQRLINDVLQERSKLLAENIRKGIPSIEALKLATKSTPIERFRPEIDKLITHKDILPINKLEEAKRILAKREDEEKKKKHKEHQKNG